MGKTSESAETCPWLWIIEALAGFEGIDVSTLLDLIEVFPVVHNDLGKNIRELIAMRYLEALFGSASGVNSHATSLDSSVGPDFSLSCEDVLRQILYEVLLSDTNIAGAKVLKRNIYPFIMNKRANTIKCELEKLKQSVTEGTHPYAERLRKRSGLALQNWDYKVPASDGKCNDLSEKGNENCIYVESMEAMENASSEEHKLDKNFSSSKRNRDYSDDEQAIRFLHEKQVGVECDDFRRNAKKNKCYAPSEIEFKKDKRVHPHRRDVSENSTERVPLTFEKGGQHTENNNVATLGEGSVLKDPNSSHKLVASDENIVAVNGCGVEHGNMIDFADKNHEFLSSLDMSRQDFSASTEWGEGNLCIKCKKGGILLICKTTTCPLMVHESCLGAPARLDAEGNFFCPFCAYSHATSECLEAKKKASLAKEDLCTFLGKTTEHRAGELCGVHRKENNLSVRPKCDHVHVKDHGNNRLPRTGREDNPEDHVIRHVNEINNLPFERSQQQAEPPTSYDNLLPSCREEGIENNRIEAKFPSVNQNNTGKQTQLHVPEQQKTNQTEGPDFTHDNEEDKIFEDDPAKPINYRHTMRSEKCEAQYKSPSIPQFGGLRRRTIPWTAEEEEMLREGVHKFGVGDKRMPWKQILEFGSNVFVKERTPVDLKDKWKNIRKAKFKRN